MPHFTALHFLQMEDWRQILLEQVYWLIFPTSFTRVMSVSHFGNSHNISNFFIIIINMFVMVICDQ